MFQQLIASRIPAERLLLMAQRPQRISHALEAKGTRLQFSGALKCVQNLFALAELLQHHAAILPGSGVIWLQGQHAITTHQRVFIAFQHIQRIAARTPDARAMMIERQAGVKRGERLAKAPQRIQRPPQPEPRRRVAGV